MTALANIRAYTAGFILTVLFGNSRRGTLFNFLPTNPTSKDPLLSLWPTKIIFAFASMGNTSNMDPALLPEDEELDWRLARIMFYYASSMAKDSKRIYGELSEDAYREATITLSESERLTGVVVSLSPNKTCVSGVQLDTSTSKKYEVQKGRHIGDGYGSRPPTEFAGMKGFWGRAGGTVDRLGAVWSK